MSNIKQVIIIRKDLKMRRGKEMSQACHASMKLILDTMVPLNFDNIDDMKCEVLLYKKKSPLDLWLNGIFTKICVGCNSEDELLKYYNLAKSKGILCSLITDSGLTEFHNIPTNTCIAIGPDLSEVIDEITGHLKLL